MRRQIEIQVNQLNILDTVDIKEVAKDAKLGWVLKTVLIAIWPLIKIHLAKRLKPDLVDFIERIIKA